jgi:hypothetical protein
MPVGQIATKEQVTLSWGGFLIEYLGRGVREHGLGVLAKVPFHLAPALGAEHDWVLVLANFLIDPSQYAYEGRALTPALQNRALV